MTTNEIRAAFEKWVLQARKQTQPFGLVERSGDGYIDLYTQKHWEGWQAALATPSVASPQDGLTDLADKWANEGNAEAQPIGLTDRRLGHAEALVSCARQLREAIQGAATWATALVIATAN